MGWGEACLAAWVCQFGALSWEHGSAQPGLWYVGMSFVRAMQAGADTSPVSLDSVNGLAEGHSAALGSLPEVAPRVPAGLCS